MSWSDLVNNLELTWFAIKVVFIYFYVFSILGHYLEVIWSPIRMLIFGGRKFKPKMFTQIPLAMPYGLGAAMLVMFVEPTMDKLGLVGSLVMTGLVVAGVEYFAGWVVEKLNDGKNPYWDYSDRVFNIKGRICLTNIILFTIAGWGFLKLIYPWCEMVIKMIPRWVTSNIFWILLIVFILDMLYSSLENFYWRKKAKFAQKKQVYEAKERREIFNQELKENLVDGDWEVLPAWTAELYKKWSLRQKRLRVLAEEAWEKKERLAGRKKKQILLYLAKVFIYFYVFSILGHYLEVVWAPVAAAISGNPEFVPRMFFQMPLAAPYGLGVAAVLVLVEPWRKKYKFKWWWTVILSGLVCTAVEWISATVIEWWYQGYNPYWDYSTEWLNFQGKVCLRNGILFGITCTAFLYWIYPVCERILKHLSRKQVIKVFWALLILFLIDWGYSGFEQKMVIEGQWPQPLKGFENWEKFKEYHSK